MQYLNGSLEYHDAINIFNPILGRKQKAIHHLYFSYLLATANTSHMNLKNKAQYGRNYKLLN
jgi:hypothetical protein